MQAIGIDAINIPVHLCLETIGQLGVRRVAEQFSCFANVGAGVQLVAGTLGLDVQLGFFAHNFFDDRYALTCGHLHIAAHVDNFANDLVRLPQYGDKTFHNITNKGVTA